MIGGSFQCEQRDGFSRFTAEVVSNGLAGGSATICCEFHPGIPAPRAIGDAWLAMLVVPAMFCGESLEIRAPVSSRLTRTLPELQNMLQSWYPGLLRKADVLTPEIAPTEGESDDPAVAAFFSGGVDSWHTAIRHRHALDALVTVKGFDIPLQDESIWPETRAMASDAGRELGCKTVFVLTDLRDKTDPGLGAFRRKYEGTDFWGECLHGAALASIGLFLQGEYGRVLVPSSWHYTRLQPWGSHPLVDALLSNGRLQLVHDGAESSRQEKLKIISQQRDILRRLRVCPDYTHGAYNCGECEKCVRTMLVLRAFGIDPSAVPFRRQPDLRAAELLAPKALLRCVYGEILDEARLRGDDELVRCVRRMMGDEFSWRRGWRRWNSRLRRSIQKRLGRA